MADVEVRALRTFSSTRLGNVGHNERKVVDAAYARHLEQAKLVEVIGPYDTKVIPHAPQLPRQRGGATQGQSDPFPNGPAQPAASSRPGRRSRQTTPR
jgi:hypothetical protein